MEEEEEEEKERRKKKRKEKKREEISRNPGPSEFWAELVLGRVGFGPSWFWADLVWAELVLGRDDSRAHRLPFWIPSFFRGIAWFSNFFQFFLQKWDQYLPIKSPIYPVFMNDDLKLWPSIIAHLYFSRVFDVQGNLNKYMWPNPTKPGTSWKTCFWVNNHKRWLAQNYFQNCIFMLIKWGTMYPFTCLKESIQMRLLSNNKWWIKSLNPYSLL